MKKIFILVTTSFLVFFITTSTSWAADFNVDCDDAGCTKTGTEPLFNSATDGFWYPGRQLTKTLNLKNSSSLAKDMAIKPTRTSSVSIIDDVINISYVTNPGGLVIWAGSLTNFYNQTSIVMGSFPAGIDQNYDVTVSMNASADNNYQSLESSYDITLGFWETDIIPTPATSEGGGGVLAPTCNDAAPASAPTLLLVTTGANSVSLTWAEASDPVSYYLIAYGVSPNNNSYGNPNVGGKGTTSYIIDSLSGGISYCFIVRAGNGCKPGAFSNQICATPTGGLLAIGPAPGFASNVLGLSTPSAKIKEKKILIGQTQGITNKKIFQKLLNRNFIFFTFFVSGFCFSLVLLLKKFFLLKKKGR